MVWFHRDERATAMGIKQTGVPAGGFFTALLAPPLVLLIGWRGAFVALGIVNFFFGFVFSYLWREPSESLESNSAQRQQSGRGRKSRSMSGDFCRRVSARRFS